jgi:hypothetical protein
VRIMRWMNVKEAAKEILKSIARADKQKASGS